MTRQPSPVTATNPALPRDTTSAAKPCHTASNRPHISAFIDMPQDPCSHKHSVFRSTPARFSEPHGCHVAIIHSSSVAIRRGPANHNSSAGRLCDGNIKECEVFQIEPEIVIALNEEENEMKIDVDSDKPEMQQIESKEDQPLVLVRPPTLPYSYGTPYKGVEVRERLQIFYTTDTFVLDDPDTIDSFVLEVPHELLNLKEGVHASLPNYVDAPFVVDISKGEGIA
ncbi:hypothetical protein Syun_003730 [Stephania yunnanensis]|uniref:Uncharacterized protein n=1 Tax=Stephania yunnanensis TaxID=152371 RepID=A0AAP0L356_9MAGN